MILLTEDDVTSALSVDLALDSLRSALDEQAAGNVQMPPRQTTDSGNAPGGLDKNTGANWLRISSAFLNERGVMGFKAMNRATGLGMRYVIVLYDIRSGELLSMMDANEVTTARTAATSALGTHLLAPSTSTTVGVLGSGVQARALIRSYASLRSLDKVLVFSPTQASRESFAEFVAAEVGVSARAVESAEDVTEASTVLIAVRATREPVFLAEWLRPGMHVTGLSSVRPDAREIDDQTWHAAALVVVDDRVNVGHSGDARSVVADGTFDLVQVPELFEAYRGDATRTGPDDITLFKSSGNAMQDVALAHEVFLASHQRGAGTDLGAFPNVKPYE